MSLFPNHRTSGRSLLVAGLAALIAASAALGGCSSGDDAEEPAGTQSPTPTLTQQPLAANSPTPTLQPLDAQSLLPTESEASDLLGVTLTIAGAREGLGFLQGDTAGIVLGVVDLRRHGLVSSHDVVMRNSGASGTDAAQTMLEVVIVTFEHSYDAAAVWDALFLSDAAGKCAGCFQPGVGDTSVGVESEVYENFRASIINFTGTETVCGERSGTLALRHPSYDHAAAPPAARSSFRRSSPRSSPRRRVHALRAPRYAAQGPGREARDPRNCLALMVSLGVREPGPPISSSFSPSAVNPGDGHSSTSPAIMNAGEPSACRTLADPS